MQSKKCNMNVLIHLYQTKEIVPVIESILKLPNGDKKNNLNELLEHVTTLSDICFV